jgi:hypothetical protein
MESRQAGLVAFLCDELSNGISGARWWNTKQRNQAPNIIATIAGIAPNLISIIGRQIFGGPEPGPFRRAWQPAMQAWLEMGGNPQCGPGTPSSGYSDRVFRIERGSGIRDNSQPLHTVLSLLLWSCHPVKSCEFRTGSRDDRLCRRPPQSGEERRSDTTGWRVVAGGLAAPGGASGIPPGGRYILPGLLFGIQWWRGLRSRARKEPGWK